MKLIVSNGHELTVRYGVVYIARNLVDGKRYVGQTIQKNPKERWKTLAETLTEHGHKVHRTTISRVETGSHMPSPALLIALTEVLEGSIDDLLMPAGERSRAVTA